MKKHIFLLIAYPVLLSGFVILFWPILWKSPIHHFLSAYHEMKQYVLSLVRCQYMGRDIYASQLPWHYLPIWILITTPLLFSCLWALGLSTILKKFIFNPIAFIRDEYIWGIVAALCTGPVLIIILLKSIVYDGWRHVFFIYPFFVLLAVYGYRMLYINAGKPLRKAAVAIMSAYLLLLLTIIIYIHPYENTYFNFAALKLFHPINKEFDMDYWGLSYKEGLEYMIKANPETDSIKIKACNTPGEINRYIINKKDRARLFYYDDLANANYYITNHRWDYIPPPGKIVYEISTFGNPVLTVYKIDH